MQKSTKGRDLAFAVGDVFGGGSFNIVNFLYPAYIALQVGIPLALSGVIMFIARIWDAIIDPMIGQISDRTKGGGRFGKRRIYLLIGSPLIIVAMFLMFFPWAMESVAIKFVAVLISYMLFCFVQSMIMIPYYSLGCELTPDYNKRNKANTIRLGFSIFSSIICVVVPGMIATPGNGTSYMVMTLIFGSAFAITLLITALFAKEEKMSPPLKTKINFRELFMPLKLRPFRQFLCMQIATSFTMAVMSGLFFFYINYWLMASEFAKTLQGPFLGMIAAGIMFLVQIVALPFYLRMIKKVSKPAAYRLGALIWIISALVMFIVPKDMPMPWLILVLAAIIGFGISGPGLIPHTLLGDVADVGAVKFKQQMEGGFSGLQNLINQLSQALGMLVVMAAIGWAGFQESYYENGSQIIPAVQTDGAMLALRLFMSLTPLVLLSIAMFISTKYRVTQQVQAKSKTLIERRLNGENSAEFDAECTEFVNSL